MTIASNFRELEIRIARYRQLEREVTDPLAVHLLQGIVQELESDLVRDRERAQGTYDQS